MLRLLLFVLIPPIIEAASSEAQGPVYLQLTEEAYRECDRQAIELVEGLAQYHCRQVLGHDYSNVDYDPDKVMNRLLYLGKYAYRGYNFLEDEALPMPADLQPQEAMLMMRACLLQTAAVKFSKKRVNSELIVDKNECVEEVMQKEFDAPLEVAEQLLRPMNVSAMLSLSKRHRCMEKVLSSFAREWVVREASEGAPDSGIKFLDRMKGHGLYCSMINMNDLKKGVEWPTLWIKLKSWKKGTIKGWELIRYYESDLPYVTIYYVE